MANTFSSSSLAMPVYLYVDPAWDKDYLMKEIARELLARLPRKSCVTLLCAEPGSIALVTPEFLYQLREIFPTANLSAFSIILPLEIKEDLVSLAVKNSICSIAASDVTR